MMPVQSLPRELEGGAGSGTLRQTHAVPEVAMVRHARGARIARRDLGLDDLSSAWHEWAPDIERVECGMMETGMRALQQQLDPKAVLALPQLELPAYTSSYFTPVNASHTRHSSTLLPLSHPHPSALHLDIPQRHVRLCMLRLSSTSISRNRHMLSPTSQVCSFTCWLLMGCSHVPRRRRHCPLGLQRPPFNRSTQNAHQHRTVIMHDLHNSNPNLSEPTGQPSSTSVSAVETRVYPTQIPGNGHSRAKAPCVNRCRMHRCSVEYDGTVSHSRSLPVSAKPIVFCDGLSANGKPVRYHGMEVWQIVRCTAGDEGNSSA